MEEDLKAAVQVGFEQVRSLVLQGLNALEQHRFRVLKRIVVATVALEQLAFELINFDFIRFKPVFRLFVAVLSYLEPVVR